MADTTSTDLAPFHKRYDQRQRLMFVAALSASVVLSAVNAMHANEAPGARAAPLLWASGIVFGPLFIAAWWGVTELIARWRDRRPPPASADDARNGVRIANAGFAYNAALIAAVIGSQVIVALSAAGYAGGAWIGRATLVAVGAALICLGNVWPRFPTPRAPGQAAARAMRINRLWGWLMVIMGLLSVLSGLFLPPHHPWPGLRP